MSRSTWATWAKWDPTIPGTFNIIAVGGREPKARRKGETFTALLEAHFAEKAGERRAKRKARQAERAVA